MARHRQGWTIRQRTPGGTWFVRFRCGGRSPERSTGTTDCERAQVEAARLYARAIATEPEPARRTVRRGALDLETLIAQWLISIENTHARTTVATWRTYTEAHFLLWFEVIEHVTSAECSRYMRNRLGLVLADTVRRELTALRSLVAYLVEQSAVPEDTVVPAVPRRATGTPHPVRRRVAAIELAPDEIASLIAALPEWSTSKRVAPFPIRARFLVQYETGLRPSLIDRLLVPLHYRNGLDRLRVTKHLDKARWDRDVPLSQAARAALDAVCPKGKEGLIFGKHDYREHLAAAAGVVLDPDRAKLFAGAHLRSARTTHWLEDSGNLPAVQYLVGHKRPDTTAKYVKPSMRAARAILGRPKNSGRRRSAKGGT